MEVALVLRSIFTLLRECQIEYMVGGSFASGAWGEPRHTNDIDVTVDIKSKAQAIAFANRAASEFTLSEAEVETVVSSRKENEAFQLLHNEILFKADLFVLTDFPFAQSAFSRRVSIEIMPGIEAFCATAEDVILRKLLWFELGHRVSDRQWNDVVKIVEVQGAALDTVYMQEWADRLQVAPLLQSVLREARYGE